MINKSKDILNLGKVLVKEVKINQCRQLKQITHQKNVNRHNLSDWSKG